jgi:hypothetical protein
MTPVPSSRFAGWYPLRLAADADFRAVRLGPGWRELSVYELAKAARNKADATEERR